MLVNPRQISAILSAIAYYLLPIALATISLTTDDRSFYVECGSLAMLLLMIILFMKPIGIVFSVQSLKRALIYRRQLGVAMFWLALFHSIGLINPEEIFIAENYTLSNYIMHGAVAMIGAGILAITSNTYSQKLLKRNWKRLQYLAYPVLFFTIVHAAMAEGEMAKVYVIIPAFIILKTLEFKRIILWPRPSQTNA